MGMYSMCVWGGYLLIDIVVFSTNKKTATHSSLWIAAFLMIIPVKSDSDSGSNRTPLESLSSLVLN
jgi:hypothetical protein